jgi:hypothetical protein
MFQSHEQLLDFMESIAFYNRFCGEFVVMGFFYVNQIASFF